MKSRMNKLMSLCLVAMMGTTFIPQPIQAEEVGEFEEATVEFEEATFEEEKQNVEASPENSVTADFEYEGLKYKITDENKKEVEVIGFADGYQPTGYTLDIPDVVRKQDESDEDYTVTSIGDNAFKDCQYSSIKEIRLPSNLRIGESAFEGFKSLVDINFYYCVNLEIGKSAFKDCTALKNLSLPKGLKSIGESAFAGCTKLNDISFALDQYEEPSLMKLETIENSAFEGCTSLWDIDFSELQHLTTIGESAFAGCTKLGRIELPEGLTTIGDLAFALGKSTSDKMSPHLRFINIPSSVKTLGSIFGNESPFGIEDYFGQVKEGKEVVSLAFQSNELPTMEEGFLNTIAKGNNKPAIFFPNTKEAIQAFAGKDSPFVAAGLVNPDYFDSSVEQEYESIQVCPESVGHSPIYDNFPYYYGDEASKSTVRKFTSSNAEVAKAEANGAYNYGIIEAYSKGETNISFVNVLKGQELVSDNNTFKVIVDHEYVWQITSFPDFFKSGSMYQKCEGGCGKKNEPIKIPSYLKLLEGLIDLDDFDFDDFDDLPSIIMGINEDQEFKSNSTYEVKNESLELIPYPLKDQEMDFEQYECSVTSSNPSVATAKIDEQGKVVVKTVGKGQAKITTSYTKKEETPAVMNESGFINEVAPNTELEGTFVMNVVESEDDIPTGGGSGGGSTGGSGGSSTGGGSTGGSTSGGSSTDSNAPTQQVENAVYRAYNPYNGEHLYTTNYGEFKVITKNGWNDEGIAFMSESKEKGQAVYRVYNPNSGLHHYTTNVNEKNALVSLGWNDEGVAFYTSKNPKDTPVYRVYNGNDGNHHYTMDANEALALISMGWKNEGIAFLTAPMK
ncbi:leucine-rich repeat domain-containing protein [Allobaculum stercoricanis]|uniref:leucine-rich repeat domain-containing protein n=1 Tax=Allobaculum stercoricanis TaxID=174709 RepID=UPI000382E9DB|nr:leucine-rich repeat domain-containing protein [Allobaculum stercoricanis]